MVRFLKFKFLFTLKLNFKGGQFYENKVNMFGFRTFHNGLVVKSLGFRHCPKSEQNHSKPKLDHLILKKCMTPFIA